jgi:hypothetical protein
MTNKTIKDMILDHIGQHIDKQNAKGLRTYGHTLEECPPEKYDWRDMMIEELIDGNQYAHKRAMEAEKRAEKAENMVEVLLAQIDEMDATMAKMRTTHATEIAKCLSFGR